MKVCEHTSPLDTDSIYGVILWHPLPSTAASSIDSPAEPSLCLAWVLTSLALCPAFWSSVGTWAAHTGASEQGGRCRPCPSPSAPREVWCIGGPSVMCLHFPSLPTSQRCLSSLRVCSLFCPMFSLSPNIVTVFLAHLEIVLVSLKQPVPEPGLCRACGGLSADRPQWHCLCGAIIC